MKERNQYQYGSEAVDYYAQPVRKQQPEREREQEVRRRPARKPKKKIDRVSVAIFSITLALAFVICFTYLQKQFSVTYLGNEIVQLQEEIVELEKANATASEKTMNSVDLGTVYNKATKELGMVSAKDSQVFTYSCKESTRVRQYSKIPK